MERPSRWTAVKRSAEEEDSEDASGPFVRAWSRWPYAIRVSGPDQKARDEQAGGAFR
jgi:hypothetical protein